MMQPSKKQKHIEFAKSVILVVLFLSTILLLYGFWWNVKPSEINIENLGSQNEPYEILLPQDVIVPAVLEISYGDGRFGVINKDTRKYWWNPGGSSFTGSMAEFFAKGNIFVESITKEQYEEVLSRESMKVIFDYDLPFSEACKLYSIIQPSGMTNISTFSEVAYSFGSMESLFVYDGKKNEYYRIVGEGDFGESSSFLPIYKELMATAYIAYPLNQLVGEGTENATLVPLPSDFSYNITTYNNERNLGGKEFEKALAESFFGETFDFTRVIEDAKGGVTYMYGYGERVFIAESGGSFRYKRESNSRTTVSDLEAMEIALDFIVHHGGTQNALGEIENISLFKVNRENSKNPKITFYFEIQKEEAIRYEEGAAFIVECTGDTVTSFYRDLFVIDTVENQTLSAGEHTAINVLAKNFEKMAQELQMEGLLEYKADEAFESVIREIKGVRLVETRFGKADDGFGKLETCWSFSFQKSGKTVEFYYSIEDGVSMGYSIR